MAFSIRPFHRFPVQCSVTYKAGPFQGQGIIWKTLWLSVTLQNKQRIEIPEAVVRWSSGQEFAVENLAIESNTQARLQPYVKRLVLEPAETML